jgi:hypothetical protein
MPSVVITVELVDDGEISHLLIEDLRVGDRIEIRGPIGGYFVWEPSKGGPLQLIGGGSGVPPLMPCCGPASKTAAISQCDTSARPDLTKASYTAPSLNPLRPRSKASRCCIP